MYTLHVYLWIYQLLRSSAFPNFPNYVFVRFWNDKVKVERAHTTISDAIEVQ